MISKTLRHLILSLILLIGPLPVWAYSPAYWDQTSVSEAALFSHEFIDNDNCYSDFRKFRGCMTVMSKLANKATPSIMVVPTRLAKVKAFKTGKVVGRLGTRLMLTLKPEYKSPRSIVDLNSDFKQQTALFEKALRDEFESTRDRQPIDFVSNTRYLLSAKFNGTGPSPVKYGESLSAFLGASLDPHASLIPFQRLKDLQKPAAADEVGIGMATQRYADQSVVYDLPASGPAARAGVHRNDFVTRVNGFTTEEIVQKGLTPDDLFKGPAGTPVVLEISRSGLPMVFTIQRSALDIEGLRVTIEKILGLNYINIRVTNFMDETLCQDLYVGYQKAKEVSANSEISGVLLDLRDNGGGRLDLADCLMGAFIGTKAVGQYVAIYSDSAEDASSKGEKIIDLPLAILVNAGTASASEYVAAALHEYERGWIVGEKSFGKGTVQKAYRFGYDYSLISFRTEFGIYTTSGYTHQLRGVPPDFPALSYPGATPEERFALREADIFPGSLELSSSHWLQNRTVDITKINDCRRQQLAEHAFQASPSSDYQKLVAAEILSCEPKQMSSR